VRSNGRLYGKGEFEGPRKRMQEQGNAVDLNFLVEKRVAVCGRGMSLRGIALPLVRPSLGQNRTTLFQLKKTGARVELEILP
jgi:hypothetical protein